MLGERPASMDWGLGRYEEIATGLLPASEVALRAAELRRTERVLDIGCGSGNAALLAAERGGRVTAVDPAQRLLDLAAKRAEQKGLELRLLRGEAAALPLGDAAVDLVISVFGVIFAPDPQAAAAEIARVCAADGRVVLCAWSPQGPLGEAMSLRREALASTGARKMAAPAFAWHDAEALAELFSPHGFSVRTRAEHLELRASSAGDFLEAELRDHPLWIAARAALEPSGAMEAVHDGALQIFEDANEAPEGFSVKGHYLLATARRQGQLPLAQSSWSARLEPRSLRRTTSISTKSP